MKTRHPIFQGLEDHLDTSIAQRVMKAYDPTSQAPKVRHDTSIAHRAMYATRPKFQGQKDRRIQWMAETFTPPSIGLADLINDLRPFIALRATLVSDRSDVAEKLNRKERNHQWT